MRIASRNTTTAISLPDGYRATHTHMYIHEAASHASKLSNGHSSRVCGQTQKAPPAVISGEGQKIVGSARRHFLLRGRISFQSLKHVLLAISRLAKGGRRGKLSLHILFAEELASLMVVCARTSGGGRWNHSRGI